MILLENFRHVEVDYDGQNGIPVNKQFWIAAKNMSVDLLNIAGERIIR